MDVERGFCKLGQNNGIGSSNCIGGEGGGKAKCASISHNCLTLHALKVSCISFGLHKKGYTKDFNCKFRIPVRYVQNLLKIQTKLLG